ncbi:ras-related protein Rab-44 isoform X2 [Choloepus didactylus]|uniref:ras-related protein Rab-44 isoform X2 n=1 Tax=Choloepus didactylus TaxID=27675 RepID=UPI0018A08C19|nr:ras-related protein Rab-44 isoform X2 [Choloepus didactylus]XP_037700480.1 ras-related protein Rab-44 isoform X2 [Choloepus didactylus]
MESGQRVSRKGRKLGSSRRRQMREPADGHDAPEAPEPESWSSQAAAELQSFFQDCGAKDRGFVTREDLAMAKFSFLGSEEEPEMIFDWVDIERKGRLSLEEFSSALKNIFGSSPSTHRLRRRPPSSKRGSAATSFPVLEEAGAEEKEAFLAFMEQLGTSHLLSEQAEIWQLWRKLRQEEPPLAGNLEGFLAKMSSRLQDARADKEALELTLRKRDSDHHHEVQQLYEEMEQQIHREKQQLQAESRSRDLALSSQVQEVLEAKERAVQQLAEGQRELEAQLNHLSSTHQKASSENQQLREAERDLAGRLEEVRGQLQVTRGHLDAARGRVSWQVEEEPSAPRADEEKAPEPPVEAPLPGLFGDNDDWNQLLSGFNSPPHRALHLSWSPPPSPSPSGPQTPRVVRQISISEPHAGLFGQMPSSDLDETLRSPPGVPSRAKEVDPDGQDIHSEQPVKPQSLEPEEEPGPRPEAHFPWDPLEGPPGEAGALVAAAIKVLIPLGDESPPHVESPLPQAPTGPSEQFQASDPHDKGPEPGPAPPKPPRQREALPQDPYTAGSEPGLGSPEAGTLTPRPAKPSQGLEPVGRAPTEGLEQGESELDLQEGSPRALREAPGQVLRPDERPALPHLSLEEVPRAKEGKQDRQDISSAQTVEAQGLPAGHPEGPQQDTLPAPPPHGTPQVQAEAEVPAPEKSSASRGFPPMGAQPADTAGPQEPPQTLPTMANLETQPRPPPTAAQGEQGPPQPRELKADKRPEDTETASQKAGLSRSPDDPLTGKPQAVAGELQADPDFVFHVIFLGDSNVGKTSFLHLLHHNSFATGLTATVGVDFRVKNLLVDSKHFALQLWDTAGQERYHSVTRQLLRRADGVVLMYDVTSQESFLNVRYWLDCLQDAASDGVVILLLGNKMDCEEERQVPTEAGQELAKELGVSFGECSAVLGHNILEPMVNLARSLKMQEDCLKGSLAEVAPEKPPKKAGCCF